MALSLAGLCIDGESTIETAEAVNVTFPKFIELMTSLGANLKLTA
jgi:3-phosphoshikimate 1-carboxyvinyltransferase